MGGDDHGCEPNLSSTNNCRIAASSIIQEYKAAGRAQ